MFGKSHKRKTADRKGSATLEHALLLPVIILVLITIINIGVLLAKKGKQTFREIRENREKASHALINNRGSISVFLCIFLTGIIVLFALLCDVNGVLGGKEYFDDCVFAGEESVRTAYDKKLDRMFFLRAVNKADMAVLEKDQEMIFEQNTASESGKLYPVSSVGLSVEERKTLDDNEQLKQQMLLIMKDRITDKLIDDLDITQRICDITDKGKDLVTSEVQRVSDDDLSNTDNDSEKMRGAIDKLIKQCAGFIADLADEKFGENTWLVDKEKKLAVNEYVTQVFSNRLDGTELNDAAEKRGHCQAECEHVIAGKKDAQKDIESVENRIQAIRFMSNAAFFYSSPYKFKAEEIATVSTAAYPELKEAVAVAVALIWIDEETDHDMEQLLNGKKVAFFKDVGSWHTRSVSSVISGKLGLGNSDSRELQTAEGAENTADGTEDITGSTGGSIGDLSYEDYLRILLLLQGEDTKLLRVKEVIKNATGTEADDYISGIRITAKGRCRLFFTAGSRFPQKYVDGRGFKLTGEVNVDMLGSDQNEE